jgi:alpha-beta hydrolase superfamily lysophospholipase
MASHPAVVIVPGSFVPAHIYHASGFVDKLKAAGYDTVEVIDLATVGQPKEQIPSMADDAALVAAALEKLTEQGKDVLLMPHSYGGIPASEGMKGYAKSQRVKEGKTGGVVAILYVTSVVPKVGESTADTLPVSLDFVTVKVQFRAN